MYFSLVLLHELAVYGSGWGLSPVDRMFIMSIIMHYTSKSMYGVDDTVRQSKLISSVLCTGAAFKCKAKFPTRESFQAIIGQ